MPTFELMCDPETKTKFELSVREEQVERVVYSEELTDAERSDDYAYLTVFIPPEDCDEALRAKTLAFQCCSQEQCVLGDPKDRTPGDYVCTSIL